MSCSDSPPSIVFLLLFFPAVVLNMVLVSASSHLSLGHETISERDRREDSGGRRRGEGRRFLTSFKETPHGGNVSFECSPSGPCIACLYSEKNDEKYRCSETGYRIPLNCVEIGTVSKETNSKKMQKSRSTLEHTYDEEKLHVMLHETEELTTSIRHRNLLDDSSTLQGRSKAYISYRSCIPAVNEEKLSVLGFEGIMLCLLLISGSVVFFRRKQSAAMSGAVRVPTNSRF